MAPSELLRPLFLDAFQQGAFKGFAGLASLCEAADADCDGLLTVDAFQEALEGGGVQLRTTDMLSLADQFEGANQGTVRYRDFVKAMQGKPSRSRRVQMRAVFDMLDDDGDGRVAVREAEHCFRAAGHPGVRVGTIVAPDLEAWAMQLLRGAARGGAEITAAAWEEFHSALTAHLDDVQFAEVMAAVWRPPGERRGEVTSKRTNYRTGAVGVMEQLRRWLAAANKGPRGFLAFGSALQERASPKGQVKLEDLEAAVAEASVELDSAAVSQLFRHFDHDGVGNASATEIFHGVRGMLPPQRLALVRQAFAALDTRGDGLLLPGTVAARFHAAGHPDVAAGKGSAEERVRAEFLENFLAGGVVPGRVTAGEWEDYHAALGATVESDERFEAIMRGLWSLATPRSTAGQPPPPPSGTSRTGISWDDYGRAAGQSSVREAIHGGSARVTPPPPPPQPLPLPATAAAAAARPPAGRHAASPQRAGMPRTSPFWVDERLMSPAPQQAQRAAATPPAPPSPAALSSTSGAAVGNGPLPTTRFGMSQARNPRTSPFATDQQQPRATGPPRETAAAAAGAAAASPLATTPPRASGLPRGAAAAAAAAAAAMPFSRSPVAGPGSVPGAAAAWRSVAESKRQADAGKAQEAGRAYTLAVLRAELARQGPLAAARLRRAMREAEGGSRGALTLGPFRAAVRRAELQLSDADVRRVFEHVDSNGYGAIRIADLFARLRETLPPRRAAAIAAAWAAVDARKSGSVEPGRLIECFRAAAHPDVVSGEMAASAATREFFESFEVGATVPDRITAADFANHYADMSPGYEDDDLFDAVVCGPWGLPVAAPAAAASSSRGGGGGGRTAAAASKGSRSPRAADPAPIGRFASRLGGGGGGGGAATGAVAAARGAGNVGSVGPGGGRGGGEDGAVRPRTFAELRETRAAGGSAVARAARSEASLALRRQVLAEKSQSQISFFEEAAENRFAGSGGGSGGSGGGGGGSGGGSGGTEARPQQAAFEPGRRGSIDGRRHVQPLLDPFQSHLGRGLFVDPGASPLPPAAAAAGAPPSAAAVALPLAALAGPAVGFAAPPPRAENGNGSVALRRLRAQLAGEGVSALAAFCRDLRAVAHSEARGGGGSGGDANTISLDGFCEVLRECGGAQWGGEAAAGLYHSHQVAPNGGGGGGSDSKARRLDLDAFVAALVGELPPRRQAAVRQAFQQLAGGSGAAAAAAVLAPAAVLAAYDAAAHPDVIAGARAAEDILEEFSQAFEVGEGGEVALADFEAYHAVVSATVPADEAFERLVRSVWGASSPASSQEEPELEALSLGGAERDEQEAFPLADAEVAMPATPPRPARARDYGGRGSSSGGGGGAGMKAALSGHSSSLRQEEPAPVSGSAAASSPGPGHFGAMQRARARGAAAGAGRESAGAANGTVSGSLSNASPKVIKRGGVAPRVQMTIGTDAPQERASGGPSRAGNLSPTYRSNIMWG